MAQSYLPILQDMLSYLQTPINTDPAGSPALSLGLLDTSHAVASVRVVLQGGWLSLWNTTSEPALLLLSLDLSTLTMGQLAASLTSFVAAQPTFTGGATVLSPARALTDRDWTNAPATMLLETTGECSTDRLAVPTSPLVLPVASVLPLLAYTSPLWSLLVPLARELTQLTADAQSVLQNMSLPTAGAPWVDAIARLYGVTRVAGEDTPSLITRTMRRVGKPACNNVAIADSLLKLLGVSAQVLDAPTLFTFIVRFAGVPTAPLSSIVSTVKSLQLAGTGFTVQVPLPVLRPQYPYTVTGGAPRAIDYAQNDLLLPTSITGTVFGDFVFGANAVPTTLGPTTALSSSASLLTYTIANTLGAGQTVTCVGAAPGAYNGTFLVNTATSTSFTVSSLANPGAGTLQGVISTPWRGTPRTRVFAPQSTLTLY